MENASNRTEANRLNQLLSEVRARNVHKAVEDIVKRELPALPIEVPAKGVGSRELFPTAGEDNAAVDRCVVLMVDLTSTLPVLKSMPRSPRLVYAPSTFWVLKVVSMAGQSGVGARAVFLRFILRNPFSGREITFSGWLAGGALSGPKASNLFQFDKPDPRQLLGKQVGDQVTFMTPEPMDFDDWIRDGQSVRLFHTQVKTGVTKSNATFLQFVSVDTDPGSLVFELKPLGLSVGWPDIDLSVVAGKLPLEGNNPGDYVLTPTPDDVVWTQKVHHYNDGLLLSFPTGKSDLHDLTKGQRKQLTDFVTNKVRNIGSMVNIYNVSAPVH
jgi:hypothetical protein